MSSRAFGPPVDMPMATTAGTMENISGSSWPGSTGVRRFPHAERKPPDECGRLDLGDQVLPDVNDIERGRRQLFGNIIKCAGTEGAEGDFRVFFGCGTDPNDGPAALSHDAAQSLDAIESRHLDIESDDIWIERRDFFQCLRSVACHSMT